MILCACGCGQEIVIRKWHKWEGIPKYIPSHYFKTKESRMRGSERIKKINLEENPSKREDVKIKLSIVNGGINNPFYGKKHSKEAIEKNRNAHIGKRAWNKGKSWEETYGIEKANLLSFSLSSCRKGKTHDEIFGVELAKKIRERESETKKRLFAEGKITVPVMKGEKNPFYGKHHSEETKLKLKLINLEKNKGKTYEELYGEEKAKEIKNKISESKKGEKSYFYGKRGELSPTWLGGKSFEPYSPEFNLKFKNSIRQRDNQICMNCGIHREKLNKSLNIHHINYDKALSIPENCISLCSKCHLLANINREYWTKLFQEKMIKLYDYKYSEKGDVILEVKEKNDTI